MMFPLNAFKKDQGKPKVSLVPPRALIEVAKVMTFGAVKYDHDNYLQGKSFVWRRLVDSLFRHVLKFLCGIDRDEESGLHHLAHAAACALMLLEIILVGRGQDDRFDDDWFNGEPLDWEEYTRHLKEIEEESKDGET